MRLDGIHHITCITRDAPRNVDFYARVLGLRMVKKTVNQDDPRAYHLFYADEAGSPGADITFFEWPDLPPGRAGAGMVSQIVHRVASEDALAFWEERLSAEGVPVQRSPGRLRFANPEGLEHELAVVATTDPPLVARSSEVPEAHAIQGFDSVRALVGDVAQSEAMVRQVLGFTPVGDHEFESRGEHRGSRITFERATEWGVQGGGTVHHIAWSAARADLDAWRERIIAVGGRPTPVIDRFWFESVYFREPSGILYELATRDGAGFDADEPAEHLGERLTLPPDFEHLRAELEQELTPLPDVRRWRPGGAPAA